MVWKLTLLCSWADNKSEAPAEKNSHIKRKPISEIIQWNLLMIKDKVNDCWLKFDGVIWSNLKNSHTGQVKR